MHARRGMERLRMRVLRLSDADKMLDAGAGRARGGNLESPGRVVVALQNVANLVVEDLAEAGMNGDLVGSDSLLLGNERSQCTRAVED